MYYNYYNLHTAFYSKDKDKNQDSGFGLDRIQIAFKCLNQVTWHDTQTDTAFLAPTGAQEMPISVHPFCPKLSKALNLHLLVSD